MGPQVTDITAQAALVLLNGVLEGGARKLSGLALHPPPATEASSRMG